MRVRRRLAFNNLLRIDDTPEIATDALVVET